MSKSSNDFLEFSQERIEQVQRPVHCTEDIFFSDFGYWLSSQGIVIPEPYTVKDFISKTYQHDHDATALVTRFINEQNFNII